MYCYLQAVAIAQRAFTAGLAADLGSIVKAQLRVLGPPDWSAFGSSNCKHHCSRPSAKQQQQCVRLIRAIKRGSRSWLAGSPLCRATLKKLLPFLIDSFIGRRGLVACVSWVSSSADS